LDEQHLGVRGYENLLGPMEKAGSHFHEKVLKPGIPTNEPRYLGAAEPQPKEKPRITQRGVAATKGQTANGAR
jgi:hypothetical protein